MTLLSVFAFDFMTFRGQISISNCIKVAHAAEEKFWYGLPLPKPKDPTGKLKGTAESLLCDRRVFRLSGPSAAILPWKEFHFLWASGRCRKAEPSRQRKTYVHRSKLQDGAEGRTLACEFFSLAVWLRPRLPASRLNQQ